MNYIRVTDNPDGVEVLDAGRCVRFNMCINGIYRKFAAGHDDMCEIVNWYLNKPNSEHYCNISIGLNRNINSDENYKFTLTLMWEEYVKYNDIYFDIHKSTWDALVFNYIRMETKRNKWKKLKYFLFNKL